MIDLSYTNICDAELLTIAIIEGGYFQHPVAGARFYGVSISDTETIVHCYDDLTSAEEAGIDAIVNNQ